MSFNAKAVLTAMIMFSSLVLADTFTNKTTGESFNGYSTSRTIGNKTMVHSEKDGIIKINPFNYDIEPNSKGRKNTVTVINIDQGLIVSSEVDAVEKEIESAANRGHKLVILEMDAKEGSSFAVKSLCSKMTSTRSIPIVAFINAKKQGGLFDHSVCLAFACDKIYMSKNAQFGAVMIEIPEDEKDKKDKGKESVRVHMGDLREIFGEDVGEKFTSAQRGYISSVAQRKNRSGLIATAMIDRKIKVIEVQNPDGSKEFTTPANKRDDQKEIKEWCPDWKYIVLTADDAIYTGMADEIVDSMDEILKDYDACGAEICIASQPNELRGELDEVIEELRAISKSIDEKNERLEKVDSTAKQAATLSAMAGDYIKLLNIAKKYPEFGIDAKSLEFQVNRLRMAVKSLRG